MPKKKDTNESRKKTSPVPKKAKTKKNPHPNSGEVPVKDPSEYKTHGWFNPKYDLIDLESIPSLYENGESDIEVCVALDICSDTFYEWMRKHPEFAKYVKSGREKSQAWWQRLGRGGAAGKVKNMNAAIWFGNMKNRFGWRDNHDVDLSNNKEFQEVKAMISKIKKHEKDE